MQATTPMPQLAPAAGRSAPTATEMYEAAKLMQRELGRQHDALLDQRRDLRNRMEGNTNSADLKGLESQLTAVDARIADVEKQQAQADAMVAQRASVPGVVIQPEIERNNDIPEGAVILGAFSIGMVLLLPVSIAWARRIWNRAPAAAPALPNDLGARMENIERSIESVAIEVERLGEGQRFVTQLLDSQARRAQLAEAPREPR